MLMVNFHKLGKKSIPYKGNRVEIDGEEFNLTPEIQREVTDTRYNLNNIDMDDESVLTFDKI